MNDSDRQELITIRYSDGEILSRQLMEVDEMPYCVTHDGTLMLTCRNYQLRMGGPGRLFNLLQKTDPRVVFDAQWQPLYGASLSPDGRYAVVSLEPHLTRVIDVLSGAVKEQFEGHLTGGKAASFTPDGSRLITGASGWDAIRIWDVRTWRSLLTLAADGVFISPVQLSEDGNLMGALDTGMKLHLWRAPSWEQIAEAECQN